MMSFCKNSLHAFLGISNRDIPSSSSSSCSSPPPPPSPPPGLNSISTDHRKPLNILESTSLKPPTTTTTVKTKDPIVSTSSRSGSGGSGSGGTGSGCLDDIGSGGLLIHGLSSCTESLGFESSEQMEQDDSIICKTSSGKRKQRSRIKEDLNKKFPPVLSSLRQNDTQQHSTSMSFLKPVRENGRLLLTKVTINKPEVFHSSRQDGRLRLQLIHQNSKSESSIPEEVKEAEQNKFLPLPRSSSTGTGTGAGEALTRCHELVNRHQERYRRKSHLQQHHQLWNQQCV